MQIADIPPPGTELRPLVTISLCSVYNTSLLRLTALQCKVKR